MIESRIVEATDTFSRNLGVRLGYREKGDGTGTFRPASANVRGTVGGSLGTVAPGRGHVDRAALFNQQPQRQPAGADAAASVFSMILFNQNRTKFIDLELTALQADGKGKIISSPRVITADQVEATIEQGTEIPYQPATSSGATSMSFKKATLSLKVKPQVTPDDNVIMNLKVNKDSVSPLNI